MPVWLSHFVENLFAGWVSTVFEPTSMPGLAIALAVVCWMVISWHRRQRAAKKLGMASWYFIVPSIVVALVAVAGAAFGVGLRSANLSREEQTASLPIQVGPFKWAGHLGHSYTTENGTIVTKAVTIFAKNTLQQEIKLEDAYVLSDSGRKVELKVASGIGIWVAARAAAMVPPKGDITLQFAIDPPNGIAARNFFDEWKVMYVTVKHDGDQAARTVISEKMVSALYENFRPNPLKLPPTRTAQKVVPNVLAPVPFEYVSNQSIGSTFNPDSSPQPAVLYEGTLAAMGNRLRIFVDLLVGSYGWPFEYQRIQITEIRDFVRGQRLNVPVVIREEDTEKNWIFRWGESDQKFRPSNALIFGRIALVGDNGIEQRCYFMIVPWTHNGKPWIHLIPATRLNFAEEWEKKDATKTP